MNYSINSFLNFKQWKAAINVQEMLCIKVVDSDRTKVARSKKQDFKSDVILFTLKKLQ